MPLNLDLTSGNDAIKYRMVGLPVHSWLPPSSVSVMAALAKTWILSGQKGCDQDPRQITTAARAIRGQSSDKDDVQ